MCVWDDNFVEVSAKMEAVVADIGYVVAVGGPWREVVGETAVCSGGILVDVFVFCHVSIGRLHTIVTIFPRTLPLLPLPHLR